MAVMSDQASNGGYFSMRNEVSKLQWELNVSKRGNILPWRLAEVSKVQRELPSSSD